MKKRSTIPVFVAHFKYRLAGVMACSLCFAAAEQLTCHCLLCKASSSVMLLSDMPQWFDYITQLWSCIKDHAYICITIAHYC